MKKDEVENDYDTSLQHGFISYIFALTLAFIGYSIKN
jgi:hypothetical protein